MIVQVSYAGSAEDFAWILPLPDVPDAEKLGTFPMDALVALDAGTAPAFLPPTECNGGSAPSSSGGCGFAASDSARSTSFDAGMENGVDIYIRKRVGDYEAAVVGSEDPMLLIDWLIANDYNVTEPMLPYIRQYAQNDMRFLALKLVDGASVSDIAPIDLTLPGQTPSIPLRLTALAAEPEMGIVVVILGDQRFSGANWPDVEVDLETVPWALSDDGTFRSGWSNRVASAIDEAGGRGWVTEVSEPKDNLQLSIEVALFQQQGPDGEPLTQEQQQAASAALGELLNDTVRVTRLYARVSAEEMLSDPIFKRVEDGEDVVRTKRLHRMVGDLDMCPTPGEPRDEVDPCEFSTCGAQGLCRSVTVGDVERAGCACAAGTTARTTMAPDGGQTVICQDQRLSFVNPGVVDMVGGSTVVMDDPCQSMNCGAGATCVAMNMTPTCVCAKGMVAVPASTGRGMSCVVPDVRVPDEFYLQPVTQLDASQEIGRDDLIMPADTPEDVDLPESEPVSDGTLGGGGGFEGCTVRRASAPIFGTVFSVLFALAFVTMRRFER